MSKSENIEYFKKMVALRVLSDYISQNYVMSKSGNIFYLLAFIFVVGGSFFYKIDLIPHSVNLFIFITCTPFILIGTIIWWNILLDDSFF